MSLAEANDAIGNTFVIGVIKNGLLTNKFTNVQELLINLSPSGQKTATTGG